MPYMPVENMVVHWFHTWAIRKSERGAGMSSGSIIIALKIKAEIVP